MLWVYIGKGMKVISLNDEELFHYKGQFWLGDLAILGNSQQGHFGGLQSPCQIECYFMRDENLIHLNIITL